MLENQYVFKPLNKFVLMRIALKTNYLSLHAPTTSTFLIQGQQDQNIKHLVISPAVITAMMVIYNFLKTKSTHMMPWSSISF